MGSETMRARIALVTCSSLLLLLACGDDEPGGAGGASGQNGDGGERDGGAGDGDAGGREDGGERDDGGANTVDAGGRDPNDLSCDVVVSDADCDESKAPFVFVHGTYGSGDNIANIALLFGSNGYCQDRFVAVDYNSLGDSPQAALTAEIDRLIEETGHDQVVLAGHSQGTGHCRTYLNDAASAAKVSHYINFSGMGAIPNDVKTLSVSSLADIGNTTQHATGAEEEVTYDTADHFTLAASKEAFVDVWEYLYGQAPTYTEVQCGDEMVTLAGLAETFAENVPVTGGEIRVHELGDDPRERGEPVLTLVADEQGAIAPFQLERNVAYEFESYDEEGSLVGHQYFPPFRRSNHLLRFLAPSETIFISLLSTDNIDRSPNHVGMVFRFIGGAFRQDVGHSLKIDGNEVLSADNASLATTTVGLFLYDDNLNMMSELGAAFSAPFLIGSDVYVDATEPAFMEIEWNGERMRVPNHPSDKGLVSVMLR
jgi:pimeloyl-ACP methyl ester carboxylesterase